MRKKTTVLVADDCEIFRSGLRQTFDKANLSVELIEAGSPHELLPAIGFHKPQVIFLNIAMHLDKVKLSLADITSRLSAKIIILYDTFHTNLIQSLFNEHVHGFICKSANGQEFVLALDQVVKDGVFYCHQTGKLLSSYLFPARKHTNAFPMAASFTQREKQIIHLICLEYTAKEIADKLSLSKRTIENRKIRILEKMHAKNIAGIVAYAYKYNLVDMNL